MIVCVCNNISDREIRQALDFGLSSFEELQRDLGVATCCGQCKDCTCALLDEHLNTEALSATALARVPQAA